jgi:hypothetical protein
MPKFWSYAPANDRIRSSRIGLPMLNPLLVRQDATAQPHCRHAVVGRSILRRDGAIRTSVPAAIFAA